MITVSILDCDLLNIERVLKDLKINNITRLHIDILDTSFVSNISFGPGIVNNILKHDFIFDIHLMVKSPITILNLLDLERVDTVFIHYEIDELATTVKYLTEHNKTIDLAINPDTSIEVINYLPLDILSSISKILIMTVYPGFGNQKFNKDCIDKLKNIDRTKFQVGVDGGINLDTIDTVKKFDFVVIGSAYFKEDDKTNFIKKITDVMKK